MAKYYDLIGQRFGKLVVLEKTAERDPNDRSIIWKCQCDCGNITYATTGALNHGYRRSCGCYAENKSANRIDKRKFSSCTNEDGAHKNHIIQGKIPKTNTSGYKGVTYDKSRDLWKAGVMYGYKNYTLVKSKNKDECIKVRKMAEAAIAQDKFFEWLTKYRNEKKG